MVAYWTDEENALLKALWKTNAPITSFLHRFPGRTEAATRHHAHRLGCAMRGPGPKPVIEKAVIKMIRDEGPICSAEMAKKLLCRSQQIDQYVRRLRAKKKIYVGGYVELHKDKLSRLWVYGKGPDAIKPKKSERPAYQASNPTPSFKSDPLMAALYKSAKRVYAPTLLENRGTGS